MASDAQKLCYERVLSSLDGAEFTHYDESRWGDFVLAWLFFLRDESQASAPRSLDPMSAEAPWQLWLWGSLTNWQTREFPFLKLFQKPPLLSYQGSLPCCHFQTEGILRVSMSSSEEFRCREGWGGHKSHKSVSLPFSKISTQRWRNCGGECIPWVESCFGAISLESSLWAISPCIASSLKTPALPMLIERAHMALEGAECSHCDESDSCD